MELLIVIFGGILVHLLASEFMAHTPALVRILLKMAVAQLPTDIRDRYREEWSAHANEIAGMLAKLLFGIECVLCGYTLGRVARRTPIQFQFSAHDDRKYFVGFEEETLAVDGGTALHILNGLLVILKEDPLPEQLKSIDELEVGIATLKRSLGDKAGPTPALLKEWSALVNRVDVSRKRKREI